MSGGFRVWPPAQAWRVATWKRLSGCQRRYVYRGLIYEVGGATVFGTLKHHRVVPPSTMKKVDQSMVAVLSYELGGTLEAIKKGVENYFADKQQAATGCSKKSGVAT